MVMLIENICVIIIFVIVVSLWHSPDELAAIIRIIYIYFFFRRIVFRSYRKIINIVMIIIPAAVEI